MVILVAGLTPAWQQILTFDHLQIGEVNRAAQVTACASGKVLNVGCALHHLGAKSHTLCPIGGTTGELIRQDFATLGIPTTWTDTQTTTRVCTTLLDQGTGQTTELVENSAALTTAELDAYVAAYAQLVPQADFVVLSGSLPQTTPRDFYTRLLDVTSCRVLLDVRGPELQACLKYQPWLVKPNREELAATVGRPLSNREDLIAAMQTLREAGAQHVIVSDGPRTLLAAGPAGIADFSTLQVKTVNPIGCGDCLAAGLAVAAVEQKSWSEIVRFGIAAAAENAAHLLPARFSRSDVDTRV
ncbi:hexose kinase [bacterium]|nr:hexose kinase [bacterium]